MLAQLERRSNDFLILEAKGKGHVVGDATCYAKLSALGLQRTAKGFQKRRQPARRVRPSRPIIDAVDVARGRAVYSTHPALRSPSMKCSRSSIRRPGWWRRTNVSTALG